MSEFDKMVNTFMGMLLDYKQGKITRSHCVKMSKMMSKYLEEQESK